MHSHCILLQCTSLRDTCTPLLHPRQLCAFDVISCAITQLPHNLTTIWYYTMLVLPCILTTMCVPTFAEHTMTTHSVNTVMHAYNSLYLLQHTHTMMCTVPAVCTFLLCAHQHVLVACRRQPHSLCFDNVSLCMWHTRQSLQQLIHVYTS